MHEYNILVLILLFITSAGHFLCIGLDIRSSVITIVYWLEEIIYILCSITKMLRAQVISFCCFSLIQGSTYFHKSSAGFSHHMGHRFPNHGYKYILSYDKLHPLAYSQSLETCRSRVSGNIWIFGCGYLFGCYLVPGLPA